MIKVTGRVTRQELAGAAVAHGHRGAALQLFVRERLIEQGIKFPPNHLFDKASAAIGNAEILAPLDPYKSFNDPQTGDFVVEQMQEAINAKTPSSDNA